MLVPPRSPRGTNRAPRRVPTAYYDTSHKSKLAGTAQEDNKKASQLRALRQAVLDTANRMGAKTQEKNKALAAQLKLERQLARLPQWRAILRKINKAEQAKRHHIQAVQREQWLGQTALWKRELAALDFVDRQRKQVYLQLASEESVARHQLCNQYFTKLSLWKAQMDKKVHIEIDLQLVLISEAAARAQIKYDQTVQLAALEAHRNSVPIRKTLQAELKNVQEDIRLQLDEFLMYDRSPVLQRHCGGLVHTLAHLVIIDIDGLYAQSWQCSYCGNLLQYDRTGDTTQLEQVATRACGQCEFDTIVSRYTLFMTVHMFCRAPNRIVLPRSMFAFEYNNYYNHSTIGHFQRGGEAYVLPRGYFRLGVTIPDWDTFDDWSVGYHGTPIENVKSILNNGLMIPGALTSEGKRIKAVNTKFAKPGTVSRWIYATKSVDYAEHPLYSCSRSYVMKPCTYLHPDFYAIYVFQVRVRPGTYYTQGNTLTQDLWPKDLLYDRRLGDSELEWVVANPSDVKVYGLLVKVMTEDPWTVLERRKKEHQNLKRIINTPLHWYWMTDKRQWTLFSEAVQDYFTEKYREGHVEVFFRLGSGKNTQLYSIDFSRMEQRGAKGQIRAVLALPKGENPPKLDKAPARRKHSLHIDEGYWGKQRLEQNVNGPAGKVKTENVTCNGTREVEKDNDVASTVIHNFRAGFYKDEAEVEVQQNDNSPTPPPAPHAKDGGATLQPKGNDQVREGAKITTQVTANDVKEEEETVDFAEMRRKYMLIRRKEADSLAPRRPSLRPVTPQELGLETPATASPRNDGREVGGQVHTHKEDQLQRRQDTDDSPVNIKHENDQRVENRQSHTRHGCVEDTENLNTKRPGQNDQTIDNENDDDCAEMEAAPCRDAKEELVLQLFEEHRERLAQMEMLREEEKQKGEELAERQKERRMEKKRNKLKQKRHSLEERRDDAAHDNLEANNANFKPVADQDEDEQDRWAVPRCIRQSQPILKGRLSLIKERMNRFSTVQTQQRDSPPAVVPGSEDSSSEDEPRLINIPILSLQKKKHAARKRNRRRVPPRCTKCGEEVHGRVVNALNSKWHPECFLCVHCNQPFDELEGFCIDNDVPYHEDCWDLVHTDALYTDLPTCGGCRETIEECEDRMLALNKKWHVECFRCELCDEPIHEGVFTEKRGKPYCEYCCC